MDVIALLILLVLFGAVVAFSHENGRKKQAEIEREQARAKRETASLVRETFKKLNGSFAEVFVLFGHPDQADRFSQGLSVSSKLSIPFPDESPAGLREKIERLKGLKRNLTEIRKSLQFERDAVSRKFKEIYPNLPPLGTGQWGVKAMRADLLMIRQIADSGREISLDYANQLIAQVRAISNQFEDEIQTARLRLRS